MGKSFLDTNLDAQYDRVLQMQQNALLQEQNDMLQQAQEEAEAARNRERSNQIFKQGQAKLAELTKYAAERDLVKVGVYPVLGDLGEYKREIIPAALKPFTGYCEQLAKEDRYFNGEEYNLVINRTIKLGDINGIAKTHKEPFVVVPVDAGLFYVLPMDVIRERTGDGYEGKDIALPEISHILFLKPDELPIVAQMLVNAKNAADRAAKAIAESSELKDLEEKIKNIPEAKGGCLGFIGKILLVSIGAIAGWNVGGALIKIPADLEPTEDVANALGFLLGTAIALIILLVLFISKRNTKKKTKKLKDDLLRLKKETITRIILESVSSTATDNKHSLPPP
jgi:hypothetical protein